MKVVDSPAWTPEQDVTKLDKPLRREIEIGTRRYTLVVDPQGIKLKRKGHRHGLDLRWISLVNQIDDTSGFPLPPTA